MLGYAIFRQYRDGTLPALSRMQRKALAVFISLSFIVATWLFTHGDRYCISCCTTVSFVTGAEWRWCVCAPTSANRTATR
ncbi:hypothetical protein [Dickeya fangzhongdai]|uniref:hypothetical protein n=1 Tax=Dickeya fangzhongdai TaxID=1778540 RepID=UPI0026DFAAEE|nr:hypothetical protein [Dickeya fangzhongdai]WKV50730.1 hypothetical protein PL145_23540 [Dickeya fangzhongdai]